MQIESGIDPTTAKTENNRQPCKGLDMRYKVTKGPIGTRKVKFDCPTCNTDLESTLESAGERYPCPVCGAEIVTPGVPELAAERAEQAATEARERQRAEAEAIERTQRERAAAEHAAEIERERLERIAARERANQERESRQKESSHAIPIGYLAGCVLLLMLLTIGIVYLVMVRPLRHDLSATKADLQTNKLSLRLLDLDLDSLRSTVNHNARIQNLNNLLR